MTSRSYSVGGALWSLLFSLLLFAVGAAEVSAQGAGVVQGQVINQSVDGGEPVAGTPVALQVYKGMSLEGIEDAVTDAEGRFRFEGLETGEDYVYQVTARYGGVSYFSEFLVFGEDEVLSATLSVYEPTHEGEGIHVERAHMIVTVNPRRLRVGHLYVFSNPGRGTYIGASEGMTATLRFSVPAYAEDLEIQDGTLGGRYIKTDEGFVDTAPVPPGVGSTQVLFSYSVPFAAPERVISVTTHYSVTALNVLVSDPAVKVESPILESQGLRSFQGQEWLSLVGGGLSPGETITMSLSNLPLQARTAPPPAPEPGRGTAPLRTGTLELVVGGILVFFVGFFVGRYYSQLTGRGAPISAGGGEAEAADEEEEALIAAIADLDEAYERGDIARNEYTRQRDLLKQKLMKRRE